MKPRTARPRAIAAVQPTEVVWLTTKRAQEYLGVSRKFIDRLKDEGKIPFYKVRGRIFFRKEDLDRLVEENRIT